MAKPERSYLMKTSSASRGIGELLKVYWPLLFVVGLVIAAAIYLVQPTVPKVFRIATGDAAGGYYGFAKEYAAIIAESGIELQIVETDGSVENLELLTAEEGGVDVAFVQGGIADPQQHPGLQSLGSVFPEPLWLLVRTGKAPGIERLKGARVAVGAEGSGTWAFLKRFLEINGLEDKIEPVFESASEALESLANGEIEAVAVVSAGYLDKLAEVAADERFELLSIDRAEGFERTTPYLNRTVVPAGVLDFARNVPEKDLETVAPVAQLLARDDMHAGLIELLCEAAVRTHRRTNPLYDRGDFPTAQYTDFEVSPHAERYYRDGPSFLRRYMPFWAAILLSRFIVFVIPLLTLLIPLSKIVPALLTWRIRRKILKWYRIVRDIEADARQNIDDKAHREKCIRQLDEITADAAETQVPVSYADQLYSLRMHILFVRRLLEGGYLNPDSSPGNPSIPLL